MLYAWFQTASPCVLSNTRADSSSARLTRA